MTFVNQWHSSIRLRRKGGILCPLALHVFSSYFSPAKANNCRFEQNSSLTAGFFISSSEKSWRQVYSPMINFNNAHKNAQLTLKSSNLEHAISLAQGQTLQSYGFLFAAVLYELCKACMVIIGKCTDAIFFLRRRIGLHHLPLLSHLTEECVQSRDPPASGWARQLSARFWVDQRWWKLPSNLQLRRTYSENKLKDPLQLMHKHLWGRKVVPRTRLRLSVKNTFIQSHSLDHGVMFSWPYSRI